MFDGFPIPPPPPDAIPIGPDGQFALFVLLCFLLVALSYFFFEICADLMSEEFWDELKDFHQTHRKDKKWWEL